MYTGTIRDGEFDVMKRKGRNAIIGADLKGPIRTTSESRSKNIQLEKNSATSFKPGLDTGTTKQPRVIRISIINGFTTYSVLHHKYRKEKCICNKAIHERRLSQR